MLTLISSLFRSCQQKMLFFFLIPCLAELFRAHPGRANDAQIDQKGCASVGNSFLSVILPPRWQQLSRTLGVVSQLSLSLTLSRADTNSPYYSNDSTANPPPRISLSPTAKSTTPSSAHYSSLRWNCISRDLPLLAPANV